MIIKFVNLQKKHQDDRGIILFIKGKIFQVEFTLSTIWNIWKRNKHNALERNILKLKNVIARQAIIHIWEQ